MNDEFKGRVVLVTGAAQGLGHAIARHFIEAGACVHLADIDKDGLQRSARILGATAHTADLSNRQSAHDVVETVGKAEGKIDILALAAGGVCGQAGRSLETVTEDDWRVIFDANLASLTWVCQAAAPVMKKAHYGRIVTISSGAGLRPSLTGIQAYAAAKHAVVGLTKQLSWELAPHGITVNSVAPGFVLSNPTTERQWAQYTPDEQERLVQSFHTRRHGSADDVAHAALFFASEQSGWITGQILSVDGGRS